MPRTFEQLKIQAEEIYEQVLPQMEQQMIRSYGEALPFYLRDSMASGVLCVMALDIARMGRVKEEEVDLLTEITLWQAPGFKEASLMWLMIGLVKVPNFAEILNQLISNKPASN